MSRAVAHIFTTKRQQVFLEALAALGHVGQAAKHAGVSVRTAYNHRTSDPEFAAAWESALQTAMETVLEPEAVRRAVQGVPEPIYYKGDQVGTVQKYSDTLLIFLLKGGKPEKYKERTANEHTGAGGGPIAIQNLPQTPEARDAEIEALLAKRALRNGHGVHTS